MDQVAEVEDNIAHQAVIDEAKKVVNNAFDKPDRHQKTIQKAEKVVENAFQKKEYLPIFPNWNKPRGEMTIRERMATWVQPLDEHLVDYQTFRDGLDVFKTAEHADIPAWVEDVLRDPSEKPGEKPDFTEVPVSSSRLELTQQQKDDGVIDAVQIKKGDSEYLLEVHTKEPENDKHTQEAKLLVGEHIKKNLGLVPKKPEDPTQTIISLTKRSKNPKIPDSRISFVYSTRREIEQVVVDNRFDKTQSSPLYALKPSEYNPKRVNRMNMRNPNGEGTIPVSAEDKRSDGQPTEMLWYYPQKHLAENIFSSTEAPKSYGVATIKEGSLVTIDKVTST